MHELSLVGNIIEQAQKHAEGKLIKSITLDVGVLTCVDPGAMMFCFDACKQEAGMGNTELIINRQSAKGCCRQCGHEFEVLEVIQPCQCGSLDVELAGGNDVLLSELEFV